MSSLLLASPTVEPLQLGEPHGYLCVNTMTTMNCADRRRARIDGDTSVGEVPLGEDNE
jgi:hypothetical protein